MVRTQKKYWHLIAWAIPVLFLLGFYFLPMVSILSRTFTPEKGISISQDVNWRMSGKVIGFTLYQAVLSTFFTLLIGLPSSYMFGRFSFRGKRVIRLLTTLPFILPTVVAAAGFNSLIGPRGWLNLFLMNLLDISDPPIRLLNSLPAILLAHVFYNTSIVIRVVGTVWEHLDQKLERAARVLGANPWNVFKRVTLPLILPSMLSAAILVFLFDFTSFGVILLLGGPQFTTIEVEIYIQAMHFLDLKTASILSLIQLSFSMLLTFLSLRTSSEHFAPITPSTRGEGLRKPTSTLEKTFVYLMIMILICLLVTPTAALLFRSFFTFGFSDSVERTVTQGFTLENYKSLFINDRRSLFFVPPITALRNSLFFAIAAAIFAVVLGILIAVLSSKKNVHARILEYFFMLPLGTSAVTLGLGYLSAFSSSKNSLEWFPVLILMAHTLISLPFVVRIITPAINSIPENLREAAQTLGAPKKKLWKYIDLPLVMSSLSTGAIYAFAISLGEFGATSFLIRPEYPTLPVAIYRYLNLPGSKNFGRAMAMASILLVICGLGFVFLERLNMKTAARK
jgi:thiamine transport system permease protein